MRFLTQIALSALTLSFSVYAQTWTDCNPLNGTCPPNQALGVDNYTIDFQQSVMTSRVWNTTAGAIKYANDGADFVVAGRGDTPTVKTRFYIFFGTVEIIMRAATGQGIVSSIVMQSDDLDEVDWEWIGGNNTHVQSNYFGKGNTTSYDRAIWHPVSDPQNEFHNYTVDWSSEKLDWYIDGQLIRTLKYEQANGGKNFPQTPCDVRLGIWAGGDSKNQKGVIEWAGGETDYSKGPYTMTVKSVRIRDANQASQYVWGDQTGSYQSIQIKNDTTPIKLDGANGPGPAQSAAQHWKNMSTGAKAAVLGSVGGVLAIGLGIFAFCCIKQRRAGKHERLIEDAKFEQDRAELMAYRSQMSRERNEKVAMGSVTPMMGMVGATVQSRPQQPLMPGMPGHFASNGMPGYPAGYAQNGYAQNGYAPSIYAQSSAGSVGSGRGYQRY